MPDQPFGLEYADRERYARPVHTKHRREKVLCEVELVTRHAVTHHQKPLGETLLDRMQTVADEVLRHLVEKNVQAASMTRSAKRSSCTTA